MRALCLIARLHHVAADPAHLAHQLGWSPTHVADAQDLLLASSQLGLKAKRSRSSAERLSLISLPALAFIDDGEGTKRVVVLAQCDGQRVLFQDPSEAIQGGRPVIEPLAAFAARWTGELILVASRASLAGVLARFDFSWFIPSLVKYRRLFGEVLVVSLFLQLFALVSPLFFQVVMDKVLVHRGLTTLDVLVVGLTIVVLFESALTVLRTYVFSHTTSRIDVELGARLFRHLVHLPLAYFQARRVGDSVARVRELENIRGFLTGNALTLVLDVAFSVIFIAVMFLYSVPLTLIVLVTLPLYAMLSLTIVPVLRARLNEKFARGAENQALLVETVTGIQTVKASALEPALARRWDNQLAAYVVDNAGDMVVEAPGEGVDTIETRLGWTLGTEIENLRLTGTGNVNGSGNALDNVLTGTSGANRLDGGVGQDTMIGGAGNDTYLLDTTGDVVVEAAGGGADTVLASLSYALTAEVENLTLAGTGAIDGRGNAANNVIVGNASNNRLDGGIGADSMKGGLGDDTYVVDDAGDKTVEAASGGDDWVESSIGWTLAAQVENLVLTGEAAINATGNTAGNRLTGNTAANVLNGGSGADTMLGGMGDDVYVVDNVADVVVETADTGIDVVQSAVTWTLGADVENLLLTGTKAISATGNALDNVLVGNRAANAIRGDAGNDRLDGGAGADTLAGGLGDDTYVLGRGYGGELVQEDDAAAADTDVLTFLSEISNDQIWFRHVGNDLQVSIIGTSDKATLQNWYLGSQYHVEQLKTSDGKSLLDSRVESLVSAMATFAPPAVGQTTLPTSHSALVPVISANWEEPMAVAGIRDDGQAASLSMVELAMAGLVLVGPSEATLDVTLEDPAPWAGRSAGRLRLLPDVDPTTDVAFRAQASNLVEAMATFSAASDVLMGVPPVPAFHAMPIAVSPLTL